MVSVSWLENKAKIIREEVIKMLTNAGSGHTAGPMGSADFWVALYLAELINYRADEPWWEDRDRVVLSAGHYCPVLYATLAEVGFFEKSELSTLRKINSRLQGHPVVRCLPGIEVSSGPLGQGISQAIGMAITARLEGKSWRTICFLSDGEQNEGQVWEGYMLAGKEKLNNLTLVIDRNHIQIDGTTEQVMPLEPLKAKLLAFNLNVLEVNGNDFEEIIEAFERARAETQKTSVIILKTIPGKGVSFMENDYDWHGKVPTAEEAVASLRELRNYIG